jgi:hypothetical protein
MEEENLHFWKFKTIFKLQECQQIKFNTHPQLEVIILAIPTLLGLYYLLVSFTGLDRDTNSILKKNQIIILNYKTKIVCLRALKTFLIKRKRMTKMTTIMSFEYILSYPD